MYKSRVHFHLFKTESGTLGDIIFIQSLRCTVIQSLSQSLNLPRCYHLDFTVFTRL
nr:MAG TPA: hypothetical protein [Crassvirales sp.]